jgi:hypothetical protein
MNEEQISIIIAAVTGIGIGLSLGMGIAEYHYAHKQPVSIQSDTPKQCTLKVGDVIIQGDLYER